MTVISTPEGRKEERNTAKTGGERKKGWRRKLNRRGVAKLANTQDDHS